MPYHIIKLDLSEIKKSSEKENDHKLNEDDVTVQLETVVARKAHEKAEWDRLSFIEKLVKKYSPSKINSVAILVIENFSYISKRKEKQMFINIRSFVVPFMLFMNK